MTRVASYAQSQTLLNELMKSNERLFKTQLQVANGKVAQQYKDLARDTGVLLSAKRVETRTTQFQRTIAEVGGQLDNQNIILEEISSAAADLRQTVLDGLSLNSGSGLMETIEGVFQRAAAALNAQLGGSYIFAGSQVDRAPVTAQSLADLIAAPTAQDVFTNDQQTRSVNVDTSQQLTYTFLADAVGAPLMATLKSIAEFNAGPSGPFADQLTQPQQTFLEGLLPTLKSVSQDLNLVVARNGQLQQEVEVAADRHVSTSTFIKGFISDIENVDLAEAVAKLNQDQVASQAAAHILSQLQSLSLLDFLPVR